MRTNRGWIALVCAVWLATLSTPTRAASGHAPDATAPQPAVWAQHKLIVALDNLPKRYSCDDLWYRFRDVLLELGARADYKIIPYRCEGRSPRVQLTFWLAEVVNGSQQKWAELSVMRKIVELRPGQPSTLNVSDCELMRQIKSGLLAGIPVKVLSYRLACDAPNPAAAGFDLSVSAWSPITQSSKAVAARGTSAEPLNRSPR